MDELQAEAMLASASRDSASSTATREPSAGKPFIIRREKAVGPENSTGGRVEVGDA